MLCEVLASAPWPWIFCRPLLRHEGKREAERGWREGGEGEGAPQGGAEKSAEKEQSSTLSYKAILDEDKNPKNECAARCHAATRFRTRASRSSYYLSKVS